MVNIANPVYDTVFKYLLDDRRVAVTILSALLKKKVVEVETRKNEYPNVTRDALSIFRIDFGATVEEEDGSRHLVLIELQKTWLVTETLRFRQYLGWQYSSMENILKDDPKGNGIPMIAIYILGHKLGDIEEPVVYVRRQVYDYNGNLVTKGVPDSFIDSITNDSIIVQIPYLKGRINNRLEKILSIFDQDNRTENEHILQIDEYLYEDDAEMERILHRLSSAAADATVRHNMDVEDEYFSLLDKKDTELMQQRHQIAEQGAQLEEKSTQLKEKNAQLEEKSTQLKEKNAQLEEKSTQLKEKNAQLEEKSTQLKEKNAQLEEKSTQLKEKNAQLKEKDARLKEQNIAIEQAIRKMADSGMSAEDISSLFGKDEQTIKAIVAGLT